MQTQQQVRVVAVSRRYDDQLGWTRAIPSLVPAERAVEADYWTAQARSRGYSVNSTQPLSWWGEANTMIEISDGAQWINALAVIH